ncbi:MAG: 30S ribosomal protein S18 [Acidimicrobiales bacterium]|nr:30S ribosomal protein S18 [Acidimicrobiales bacterium]
MARPPRREKNRDNARRSKKKISALTIGKIEYVDYKDTVLLRKFVSDRSKIKARRVSGNDSRQQRDIARAVKNSREMALIPYVNRVATQRRERRPDDRGARSSGPAPTPSSPPPGTENEVEEAVTEVLEEALSATIEVVDTTTTEEVAE